MGDGCDADPSDLGPTQHVCFLLPRSFSGPQRAGRRRGQSRFPTPTDLGCSPAPPLTPWVTLGAVGSRGLGSLMAAWAAVPPLPGGLVGSVEGEASSEGPGGAALGKEVEPAGDGSLWGRGEAWVVSSQRQQHGMESLEGGVIYQTCRVSRNLAHF